MIARLIAPHSAPGLSTGREVDALVLALLEGDHARYKVGQRLEERGMRDLLQPGLTQASRHADRVGHVLEAVLAANRTKV